MDGLAALGVFIDLIEKVCEIGPDSGRYLEKTIARCRPQHCEIYETSPEWRNWLVQQFKVTARTCNGRDLAETESGSVGLVHAHKVFPGLRGCAPPPIFRKWRALFVTVDGWCLTS